MADSTAAENAAKAVSAPATKAAVNRIAKEAVAAAVADQTIPVAETVAVAMEVPSRVVLNQKLVVIASVAGGMALGAGLLYGTAKFIEARKIKAAKHALQAKAPEPTA